MINNETLLVLIFIVLFIMQLLTTVASFVLLIKLIKAYSANNNIMASETLTQNESNMQIGMPSEVDAELSGENVFAEAMTLDSLDSFDELKHTESDPDRLLKILEFGLPDEELEEIMKKLGKD